MSRLLVFEPKNYSEIASVLRQLVRKAETRLAAWPHFKTAMRLLEGYGPDNAPFGTDELQVRACASYYCPLSPAHAAHSCDLTLSLSAFAR